MSTSGGTKAILAALLANLGIAVTKFVAFLLSGSSSMLAESVHSLADSGNQVLLLIGGKRAQREADAGAPVRLRPGAVRLRLPGLDHPVQRRRGVLDLRGRAQDPAPGADQPALDPDRACC